MKPEVELFFSDTIDYARRLANQINTSLSKMIRVMEYQQNHRLRFTSKLNRQVPYSLYNHPLPDIENWLTECGCQQDSSARHCWSIQRPAWNAELSLEEDNLTVKYTKPGEGTEDEIIRAFKYSLSRADIEAAVFAGP